MIVVNGNCEGCGLCARICHEHCITLVNGTIRVDYEVCSTCSQCAAICPRGAISWQQVSPVAYNRSRLPSAEQLDELFKERRTIRFFTKEKLDRQLLQEIIAYGAYAPTHSFSLRAIVVDDEEIIDELDRILLESISRLYNVVYRPRFVSHLARLINMSDEYLRAKPKIESALERGYSFNHPAAMIFVVGDKRIPLSEASAQYALSNMIYYAQAKGLGSCLWGNGPIFISRNRTARTLLGLQKRERIFGSLLIGVPDVKFRNRVEGRSLKIQWNSK